MKVIQLATITSKVCDIDSTHGEAETCVFGDGQELFQADLCNADREKLSKAVDPFAKVAVAVSPRDLARNGGHATGPDPAVLRAWLNNHGRPQSDRGRISAEDRAYYLKETGNSGN